LGNSGNITASSGKFGNGVSFNGSDDYASLSSTLPQVTNQMSFSAWIKKDDTTGNERIINQNDTIFYVEVQTRVVQFRHLNVGDGATATGNVITSAGRWYLVTATYDGVYTTVYVDGALVAQESSTGNFGTFSGTPYIGKSSASADRFFDGSIDDVRIYNRALSPREVRDLYAFAPGPVGYWNFDEGSGQSANDISGNSNTGTLGSSASSDSADPSWATGKFGKALSFDGSNDYVDRGTGPTVVNTVEFWVNPTTTTEYPLDLNGTAYVWLNAGTVTAQGFTSATIYVNGVVSSTVSAGVWNHVAVTTATSLNATDLDIGRIEGVGNHEGKIDEVRIYNYARTASQIAWDYNRGGPVGWWKFDECQGTTANDASGNGNNGTITIGASGTQDAVGTCASGDTGDSWNNGTTGKFNSSLNFDGTDDYVNMGDPSSGILDFGSNSFSISFWINAASGQPTNTIILGKGNEGAVTAGYRFIINSGGTDSTSIAFVASDGTTTKSAGKISVGLDGSWHLITGVVNRTDSLIQYYVDGIRKVSISFTPTGSVNTSSVLAIGRNSSSSGGYFSGQIDDVRVFNYALTATQIKTLFNENAAIRFGPSTGSP